MTLTLAILVILQAIALATYKHRLATLTQRSTTMAGYNKYLWTKLTECEKAKRAAMELVEEQRVVIDILQRIYRETEPEETR